VTNLRYSGLPFGLLTDRASGPRHYLFDKGKLPVVVQREKRSARRPKIT